MNCRHCGTGLAHRLVDLGQAPPSNAYLSAEDLGKVERTYPLRVFVCGNCWLVQTEDFAGAEEFFNSSYAYFSSVSQTWLAHARAYAESISARLGLGSSSLVIEVAANDGYLLRNFLAAGIPCLGVEPSEGPAAAAERLGIPMRRDFFTRDFAESLAETGQQADLVIGNNVFAHVPDINDFTKGLKTILKPAGTITLEFPHVAELIRHVQFDTIYHEHFSYLSLLVTRRIFEASGLRIFDVERLPTHGGSLRVFGCHDDDSRVDNPGVSEVIAQERAFGLAEIDRYAGFQELVEDRRRSLLAFLELQHGMGNRVAGYGAAAKGNTLLNFAGVKPDRIECVFDAAPAKQGKYLPGSHIPILPPSQLRERKPDVVLILPWNIAEEVTAQCSFIREWGGRFAVSFPELRLLD